MMIDTIPFLDDENQQSSYKFIEPKKEGKTFLVVEDDFAYQPLWEKIIKTVDSKAKILWSLSAEGAETLIQKRIEAHEHFDFIIADILLSGPTTGIDLWKKFNQSDSMFLFASSLSLHAFEKMVGDHKGMYPYLIRKPLNPRECVENLKTMLAYRHAFIPQ
jgi:response regulator of citrate/malate metabolism